MQGDQGVRPTNGFAKRDKSSYIPRWKPTRTEVTNLVSADLQMIKMKSNGQ